MFELNSTIRAKDGCKYRIVSSGTHYVVVHLKAVQDEEIFLGSFNECVTWIEGKL